MTLLPKGVRSTRLEEMPKPFYGEKDEHNVRLTPNPKCSYKGIMLDRHVWGEGRDRNRCIRCGATRGGGLG
jgi:hypothetical protein